MLGRSLIEEDLRPDYDLIEISVLAKPTSGDLLAHPERVHVGGIEEIDPCFDGSLEERR